MRQFAKKLFFIKLLILDNQKKKVHAMFQPNVMEAGYLTEYYLDPVSIIWGGFWMGIEPRTSQGSKTRFTYHTCNFSCPGKNVFRKS